MSHAGVLCRLVLPHHGHHKRRVHTRLANPGSVRGQMFDNGAFDDGVPFAGREQMRLLEDDEGGRLQYRRIVELPGVQDHVCRPNNEDEG